MGKSEKITMDKALIARAIQKPLEAYYKAVDHSEYDGYSERPGNWEENEELFKSIFKSSYVSQHLDWEYVISIIFSIIDHYPKMKPEQFAETLETTIAQTAGQRDYLAIVPFAFRRKFPFSRTSTSSLERSVTIGEFTFSPATPSFEDINKVITKQNFPSISRDDFGYATRSSNNAISSEIIVTFKAHGAEERLRFSVEKKFRYLCKLTEVFATLFSDTSPSLGKIKTVNHFFLLGKTSNNLSRLPTRKPIFLDFELSEELLISMQQPEFNDFFSDLISSQEKMYNRLKNAINFFSMAFNSDDNVTSFLFYVISMEAIFSRDKSAPIKATLSDFASILCFPPEQRQNAHHTIRKAYDLRSSIVHSGESFIDRENIEKIKPIAARTIYCSMLLCKELKNDRNNIEEIFFNHLRDRKLGVANALPPKAIWALPDS